MPNPLKLFLFNMPIMLAIDAIWLGMMTDRLYRPQIGHLMREDGFSVVPAIAFYLIYIFGIVVLAQRPALHWQGAMWRGAVYGFCAYSTYDLTNQATLRDWPWIVTVIDLAWGSALTAVVSAAGYVLATPDQRLAHRHEAELRRQPDRPPPGQNPPA